MGMHHTLWLPLCACCRRTCVLWASVLIGQAQINAGLSNHRDGFVVCVYSFVDPTLFTCSGEVAFKLQSSLCPTSCGAPAWVMMHLCIWLALLPLCKTPVWTCPWYLSTWAGYLLENQRICILFKFKQRFKETESHSYFFFLIVIVCLLMCHLLLTLVPSGLDANISILTWCYKQWSQLRLKPLRMRCEPDKHGLLCT